MTVRLTGAAAVAASIALGAVVLLSARDAGEILAWHWAAYPAALVTAALGVWSFATGLWPWRSPSRDDGGMRGLHPRLFFVRSWREINESAFGPAARPGRRSGATVDHRVVVVFLVTAFSLTLMEYFGHRGTLLRWQPDWLLGRYGELHGFAYWAFWRVFGYAVIPALAVIVTPGMRLRECGISFKGFLEHLWIYLLLFVFVLAMVLFVSFKSDFAAYYPFYKQAHLSWFDLLAWEFLYALQFLSLEFFFRGFMLHPLKRSLGAYAILAMVVPYCMIHYGKPFLEANAAIVAGVVLGTLSLRTGSIWCGALIHITVAVSMDLAALYQAGHLPSLVAG